MKRLIILSILACLLLAGCQSETWTAFFYPDGVEVEKSWQIMHGFKSRGECLDGAIAAMDTSTNPDADYECGSNCRLIDGTMPYYQCNETYP